MSICIYSCYICKTIHALNVHMYNNNIKHEFERKQGITYMGRFEG